MKHLQKAVTALLAVVLMMSMLTACVPYEPSAPSVPSVPDNSQGGTENPGEDNNTPGGDDKDDSDSDTPVQKTWATSLARAYFKAKGVSATDYHLRAKLTVEEYSLDGTLIGRDEQTSYRGMAVQGTKRMYAIYHKEKPSFVVGGAYTDGQEYYLSYYKNDTELLEWRKVLRKTPDPLEEETDTTEVKKILDLYNQFMMIPSDTDVITETFKSESKDGGTLETITLKNGVEYSYFFSAAGELKQMTSKAKVVQDGGSEMIKVTMREPELVSASVSNPFPTKFSDKPYGWEEGSEE